MPDLQPSPPWNILLQKLRIRLQHSHNPKAAYQAIQNHLFQTWKASNHLQRQQLILDLPAWLPYPVLDPEEGSPQEIEFLRDLTNFDPQSHPKLVEIRIQYAFSRPMAKLAAAIIAKAVEAEAKTINITVTDESSTLTGQQRYGPLVEEYKESLAQHFQPQFPAVVVEFQKRDQSTEHSTTIPLNLKKSLWAEFEFFKTCQPDRYLDNGNLNLPVQTMHIQITQERISIHFP